MPTEETNLVPIVRDIPTLLNLSTYQGMSDEEIESLIEYHKNMAVRDYQLTGDKTLIQQSMDVQLELYSDIARTSSDVLQSVLSKPIPWVSVSEDGTVIQNV